MAKFESRGRGGDRTNSRNSRGFGDRNFQGPRGGGGFNRSERPSFKAVCSDCGADCDLPFKPTEGRAVYCRNCFQKHRD